MFSYSAHLSIDVHCSWEPIFFLFFIQLVNKIIKSLSHLSVTLASLSQANFSSASDRLMSPITSSHLISCRRSLAHQAANLKLIEAAGLKPMELADPFLLPTQLANVVLVCEWWFFILFVIGDFIWSRLRKKIGDLGFFFFFLLWTGGGGCGCVWW